MKAVFVRDSEKDKARVESGTGRKVHRNRVKQSKIRIKRLLAFLPVHFQFYCIDVDLIETCSGVEPAFRRRDLVCHWELGAVECVQ